MLGGETEMVRHLLGLVAMPGRWTPVTAFRDIDGVPDRKATDSGHKREEFLARIVEDDHGKPD